MEAGERVRVPELILRPASKAKADVSCERRSLRQASGPEHLLRAHGEAQKLTAPRTLASAEAQDLPRSCTVHCSLDFSDLIRPGRRGVCTCMF